MTTLAAKGYTTDGVPVFLWAYGNYKYEVEVKKLLLKDIPLMAFLSSCGRMGTTSMR